MKTVPQIRKSLMMEPTAEPRQSHSRISQTSAGLREKPRPIHENMTKRTQSWGSLMMEPTAGLTQSYSGSSKAWQILGSGSCTQSTALMHWRAYNSAPQIHESGSCVQSTAVLQQSTIHLTAYS